MDEYERPETVGEVVLPEEPAGEPERRQTPEENHRFQAARLSGERTGYERAMREVRERQESELEAQTRELEFLARDVAEFRERYPEADILELEDDPAFRRFSGVTKYRNSTAGK